MIELDPISLLSLMLIQVGSRHLTLELTDGQKRILKHPAVQIIILCCLIYVSTKDIKITLIAVMSIYISLYVIFNENHPFSIIAKDVDNIKDKYLKSLRLINSKM
jgi:hypothetical protein